MWESASRAHHDILNKPKEKLIKFGELKSRPEVEMSEVRLRRVKAYFVAAAVDGIS